MTHLDRLALRCQVAGEALQLAAQTRAALFRRRRNNLLPINRLPSELLSAILIQSVNNDQPQRMKALQRLAQVAWQWWQTIKSDPKFWACITPPLESVALQIRRAGILPLRLHWPTYVDVKDQDAFKDLLARHAERWTSIEITVYNKFGLEVVCASHFPRLEYLNVASQMLTDDYNLDLTQLQALQEVHLPVMPYFSAPPSSNFPTLLRILHIDLRKKTLYSSAILESVLQLIPQLIELKVEYLYLYSIPPSPDDAPIIDLPMLRVLRFTNVVLGGEQDGIPLLAQIRAPLLENLDLSYDYKSEGPLLFNIGRTVFDELVMRPSASLNRPEDAPLYSVLRNAGPSASWRVELWEEEVVIRAGGDGKGRLGISADILHSTMDDIPGYILPHLAPFALPVDLFVVRLDEFTTLDFWDDVLDATPLLRSLRLKGLLQVARQAMNRLATEAPSSNSIIPRVPLLNKLWLQHGGDGTAVSWSEGDVEEDVEDLLERRRALFVQGGVFDPPKLVVTGPNGLVFDEVECSWLDSEMARRHL